MLGRQVCLGEGQGFSELAGGHLIFTFFGSSRWVWPPVGVSLNIMIKLAASGDMKGDLNSLPRIEPGKPG